MNLKHEISKVKKAIDTIETVIKQVRELDAPGRYEVERKLKAAKEDLELAETALEDAYKDRGE